MKCLLERKKWDKCVIFAVMVFFLRIWVFLCFMHKCLEHHKGKEMGSKELLFHCMLSERLLLSDFTLKIICMN